MMNWREILDSAMPIGEFSTPANKERREKSHRQIPFVPFFPYSMEQKEAVMKAMQDWVERASLLQFDGGLPIEQAEHQAWHELNLDALLLPKRVLQ